MADGSLWEGLQQTLAKPERGLWDGLTSSGPQQIGDRMAWRMMPPSQNVDDRRGDGMSLADLWRNAGKWMRGEPIEQSGAPSSIFPSGSYGPDIADAVDQIRFGSKLNELGRIADAKTRNDAWLRSIEEPR